MGYLWFLNYQILEIHPMKQTPFIFFFADFISSGANTPYLKINIPDPYLL
jgi:hypothetical protein